MINGLQPSRNPTKDTDTYTDGLWTDIFSDHSRLWPLLH